MQTEHELELPKSDTPSRRQAILAGASGLLAVTAPTIFIPGANSQKAETPILTPSEAEGPYWIDEKLKRSDVRLDPTTKLMESGLPLTLNVKISQLKDGLIKPLAGAYVDIWHCNATGEYSDVAQNGTTGRKFLRGYQVTDDKGQVQFTTIYPGWYQGRTVHIHARVRTFSDTTPTHDFTTQMYFDESVTAHVYKQAPYKNRPNRDTFNSRDGIFQATTRVGEASRPNGELLMVKLVEESKHAIGTFDILLDLAKVPAKSQGDRGPGGPGGPGGFGPGRRGGPGGPPPPPPFGGRE